MSGVITSIPWRDENRSLFIGGMDFYDLSGTGQGPWVPLNVILGRDGASTLVVNADGSINVNTSVSPSPPLGASTIATGQVTVASTAGGTLIAAARATRTDITIVNEGTTDVRLGVSGVTTATGLLLVGIKGAALTLSTRAAVYGIVAAATQAVSYEENYGA
jgi:hypothetical protein